MGKSLLSASFWLLFATVGAQTFYKGFTFQPGYGYYWAHTSKVANLGAHAYGGEIGITLHPSGTEHWHHLHHFPQFRILYAYYHAPFNAWMGHLHFFAFQTDLPIITLKRSRFLWRLGTGIGYVSRPFDLYQNPKNKVVGSHLNAVLQTGFFYSTGKNRLHWRLGLQLSHQSNGKVKSPNYGINVIHASIGTDYYFAPIIKRNPLPKDSFKRHWGLGFNYSVSIKQEELPDLRKYIVVKPSLLFLWRYSPIHAVSVSLDAYYDKSLQEYLNDFNKISNQIPWAFAIAPGYWFSFGRIHLKFDWGIYFYNPKRAIQGNFYQRLGLNYELIPYTFLLGVALKTHFANADIIEFGVSYFLRR